LVVNGVTCIIIKYGVNDAEATFVHANTPNYEKLTKPLYQANHSPQLHAPNVQAQLHHRNTHTHTHTFNLINKKKKV